MRLTWVELPDDYSIDADADLISLIAPNGTTVARFRVGVDPEEIEQAAIEDSKKIDESIANVERLRRSRREPGRRPGRDGE